MVCMLVWTGAHAGEVEWCSAAIRASMLYRCSAMYGDFLSFIVIAHATLSLTIIVLIENRDPVVILVEEFVTVANIGPRCSTKGECE